MTMAQLGPPPVAASRGGSAPSGSRSAAEGATGDLVGTDDGGFVAVLDGHTAPAASDAAGQAQNPDAAGPSGELPTEVVADADASPDTTIAPADVAVVIAAAVVTAAPAAIATAPVAASAAGAIVASEVVATAPPQPLPGLVPAMLDGDGAVAPVLTAAQAAALAAATADAPAAGTTPAGTAAPAPAATLTLTLSQVDPAPPTAPGTPAVVTEEAPAPAAPPRPAGQDAAAAVPKAAEAPAGTIAPAAAAAIPHSDPLAGLTRAGALTTPHELARELGHRVQMAVREGGRELLINLRPPELGHLTIRVTMTDGVLQAQILADRPEAARLLQQSLAHLGSSLGDLGYSLDSLDVAYSGQDPRDAEASTRGTGAAADGAEAQEAGGATAPAVATGHVGSAAGGLDLLA